ncbi:MAG: nuclear transport factor 2 family protein [Acidobacteriia bacterium]|nr:nuclear transport factor 2 family protein [Terriglobia bacterium]
MRKWLAVLLCLGCMPIATGLAQQKKPVPAKAKTPLAATLEAKVQQAWADYQLKRKAAFAAILTDDFIGVEDDGAGPRDKKAEVAEIDQVDLEQYALTDFKVKPIGAGSALVRYTAEYSGKTTGQPMRDKVAVAEIWIQRGGAWKLMYEQMTKFE